MNIYLLKIIILKNNQLHYEYHIMVSYGNVIFDNLLQNKKNEYILDYYNNQHFFINLK